MTKEDIFKEKKNVFFVDKPKVQNKISTKNPNINRLVSISDKCAKDLHNTFQRERSTSTGITQ